MFSLLLFRIFAVCIVVAHIYPPVIMAAEIGSTTDNTKRPNAGNGPTNVLLSVYIHFHAKIEST
jgi:hypothetical protein